jgi:FtsP/CotA-like multicopper oxidase with cupredoxin domain
MLSRRQLIQRGAAGGAGLMFGGALARASALGATSVASSLTPYRDPMPLLVDNAIDATTTPGAAYDLAAALVTRKVHQQLPAAQFFGYLRSGGPGISDPLASYLGPAIVAKTGVGFSVNYQNGLAPDAFLNVFKTPGAPGSSYLQFPPHPEVRTMTHLHGARVAAADDGNPYFDYDAFASGSTQSVTYPNEQPATLLWYHDHYVGDTRMNVVAGLAAGYLIRDNVDTGNGGLGLPHNIPAGGLYELPLVIQDRQWNPDGSLLYPVNPPSENGPWIAEYFGDTMLVNGKIWPFLVVDPCLYRLRILDGCNARILSLSIPGAKTTVIGSELGLLPTPVSTNKLVMAPAERYDVIVDFSGLAGKTTYIKNSNPAHPVSTPAPSLSNVMQIRVNPTITGGGQRRWPGVLPPLGGDLRGLGPPKLSGGSVPGRMIVLNEVAPDTANWKLNLNAIPYDGPTNTFRETLQFNRVEDWYFVNTTPDTHPMHTHLFGFQVMGRYKFDAAGFVAANGGPNGVGQLPVSSLAAYLKSRLTPFDPEEAGFKDTVKVNPGQVTVVRAKFTLPSTAITTNKKTGQQSVAGGEQRYVHHCHIVEHEDNDMMERFAVVDKAPLPPQ